MTERMGEVVFRDLAARIESRHFDRDALAALQEAQRSRASEAAAVKRAEEAAGQAEARLGKIERLELELDLAALQKRAAEAERKVPIAVAEVATLRSQMAVVEKERDHWHEVASTLADKNTIATLRKRAEEAERRLKRFADEALVGLAGIVCTPERGYLAEQVCFASGLRALRGLAENATKRETALTDEVATLRAQVERVREALAKCECGGSGRVVLPCRFCGDSTYDHNCEEREVECLRCAPFRAALSPPASGPRCSSTYDGYRCEKSAGHEADEDNREHATRVEALVYCWTGPGDTSPSPSLCATCLEPLADGRCPHQREHDSLSPPASGCHLHAVPDRECSICAMAANPPALACIGTTATEPEAEWLCVKCGSTTPSGEFIGRTALCGGCRKYTMKHRPAPADGKDGAR